HAAFFYSPKTSRWLQTRDGRLVDAHTARVEVAEIPFLRLRDKLPVEPHHPAIGFAPAIQQVQQRLDTLSSPEPLLISPATRSISIGMTAIRLEPLETVLYTHFAHMRVQHAGRGDGFITLDELDEARQLLIQRYTSFYGAQSGRVSNLHTQWATGI